MAELAGLANLGPASAQRLARIGIDTDADLRSTGSVAAFADLRARGERVSLNLLWAMEGALLGTDWRVVAASRRDELLAALSAHETAHETGIGHPHPYNRRP